MPKGFYMGIVPEFIRANENLMDCYREQCPEAHLVWNSKYLDFVKDPSLSKGICEKE